MRKIYFAALFSFAVFPSFAAWDGQSAEQWTKGDGSEANPYLIENENQFVFFQRAVTGGEEYEGKFFKLAADLDFSGATLNPVGFHDAYTLDGVPVDESKLFLGTFDGGNKTLDNVVIRLAEPDEYEIGGVGVFAAGRASTTVKNLKVGAKVEINGTGSPDVGGVMGISYGSTIRECSFAGSMSGATMEAGGIAGCLLSKSVVEGCIFTGDISCNTGTAGIVGFQQDSSVTDCLSAGTVDGAQGYYVGGIAATAERNSVIRRCVSISAMKGLPGSIYLPGISPVVSDIMQSEMSDNYYVKALTGCAPLSEQQGVKEVSEEELKGADVLEALNGGTPGTWVAGENGYPTLAWDVQEESSVSSVEGAGAHISVSGGVVAVNAVASDIDVYDLNGRAVYSSYVDGTESFTLEAGNVYVLVVTEGNGARSISKLIL